MSELNVLFRRRIGWPESGEIAFEQLGDVLERTSRSIPFENLCIIEQRTNDITKENLIRKMLEKQEGGLCYELNALFYFFLLENGFDAVLTRGVVYEHAAQRFLTLGRTHVTILLTRQNQTYVIDTGFGGNLPLKPVPLSGEEVSSANGAFRIKRADSELGDYVFEMKLKHKDTDWRIGYTFDSKKPIRDVSELEEVREIIEHHAGSPFNKNPLITKLTNKGNVTLTDTTFTQWVDGVVSKEAIDKERFTELLKKHFG
ncbi:UNVERIFIED_CONTAM: N-hydroxyarylamine O-acetyltransferase [Brevibacillus sp. OAP136]